MSKQVLGVFAASMLVLAACVGADDADIQGEDETEELAHQSGPRVGGGHRCDHRDDDHDKGRGNGVRSDAKGESTRSRRCEDDNHGSRDAGPRGREDAGAPRPTRDAGSVGAVRDSGSPASVRDAGGPVVVPPRDPVTPPGGGPVVVDDPDVIKLSDGTVIRLDRSCPSYPTAFSVTLPGCCLPAGKCGLSTHEVNVSGIPKGCFSYEQGKMLDPSFSLPEKSCTLR